MESLLPTIEMRIGVVVIALYMVEWRNLVGISGLKTRFIVNSKSLSRAIHFAQSKEEKVVCAVNVGNTIKKSYW